MRLYLMLVVGLLVSSLSGCAEMAHQTTRLYGLDCRQEKLVNGQCVSTPQKGTK